MASPNSKSEVEANKPVIPKTKKPKAKRERVPNDLSKNPVLLEVDDIQIQFAVRDGIVRAVDKMSFVVRRGQTVGIIGESGCGKSVTSRAIMNMIPKPGKIAGGKILFHMPEADGSVTQVNLVELEPDGNEIRKIRGARIAMIFQEPMSSLTPVYSAGFHIGEAIKLHKGRVKRRTIGNEMIENIQDAKGLEEDEAREVAIGMLRKVGLPKPEQRVDAYPHHLSGGQRQRVMIAIALSCYPDLLIADEPTTALDVSIEAQILELMQELKRDTGMAIIFITHNLGVVAEMADEIVVMYLGKEVEKVNTIELFEQPQHPYTQALLNSIPRIGKKVDKLATIEGMVPDPFNLPSGCVFHPRCAHMMPGKCDVVVPEYAEIMPKHWTRCLLHDVSWPDNAEAQALKNKDGSIPNRLPSLEEAHHA